METVPQSNPVPPLPKSFFLREGDRAKIVNGLRIPWEDIGDGYSAFATSNKAVVDGLTALAAKRVGGIILTDEAGVAAKKKVCSERQSLLDSRSAALRVFQAPGIHKQPPLSRQPPVAAAVARPAAGGGSGLPGVGPDQMSSTVLRDPNPQMNLLPPVAPPKPEPIPDVAVPAASGAPGGAPVTAAEEPEPQPF